jgi:hypothetical protein
VSTKTKQRKRSEGMDTSHYFIDGYSSRKGLVAIAGYPNRLRGKDVEFTTLYFTNREDWSHEAFEFDSRSVTYLGSPPSGDWWLLGKRGEVAKIGDDIVLEQVPGAGTGPDSYGYLNRIANICERLYVCGFRRQVLVRGHNGWQRFDDGMLEPLQSTGSSLEAIDGVSESCVYSVGSEGQIWFFDGSTWQQKTSPTNADLHEVKVVSSNEVLIVGQRGTLLVGSENRWQEFTSEDFDGDLWGVEKFNGEIFVAGYSGIARLAGNQLVPIDVHLGRTVLGYRLRVKDGLLWSIGNDDILVYDGVTWSEVVCPDNLP